MKYLAYCKDKETKRYSIIEGYDYPSKKNFAENLRGNGYTVRFIATEETFDKEAEKWHEKNDHIKRMQQIRRDIDKRDADKYGVSIAHYRRAYKAYHEAIMDDTRICYLSLQDFIEIYK